LVGLRDRGAIEAAIARPYSGYYRSIAAKAAALVHSLALNHGFIDGNKRTAAAAMSLFLHRSGYTLTAGEEDQLNIDVEQMVLDVVEHRMSFDELVLWFRERIVRDPTQTG
jgi:death-on-curing protein